LSEILPVNCKFIRESILAMTKLKFTLSAKNDKNDKNFIASFKFDFPRSAQVCF